VINLVSSPHGGKLVDLVAKEDEKEALLKEAKELNSLRINDESVIDLVNIAHGVYSPLEGFMVSEDFDNVVEDMRLSNDTPWTIPIVLDVSKDEILNIKEGDDVVLLQDNKLPLALMHVEEIYKYNKKKFAFRVFKTTDSNHPSVYKILNMKELLIGGKIKLIQNPSLKFEKYTLFPKETRVLFNEKGWRTIVAFQTRNAPHIGHEYLQKTALSFTDGVFINPVIGKKKAGDFRDDVIISSYEILLKNYFPKDSAVMSVLHYNMRYAGPREAILHAIIRKNFGCTHIIIGRDHAGVGNYYKPYEAQEIFKEFPNLGITPLFFREFYFCKKCNGIVNSKICPHSEAEHVKFSGTQLRKIFLEGKRPPAEFMRPEVADIILKFQNPFVEVND
jgi:sulfate adenylyltransferase